MGSVRRSASVSFDDLLIHQLVIYRNVAAMADGVPILDEWGNPTSTGAVLATVDGRIRPRTAREVPLASQAGAAISTHIGDLYPVTGLTTACWIESGGVRYDITGISDAAGAGHHTTLDLMAVT
jgi:Phage head-tail joining protein